MNECKLDVILWAHSDQAGGTEIACLLASALLSRTGNGITCGIVTPYIKAVNNFFKVEGRMPRGVIPIEIEESLRLGKDDGKVCAKKTLEMVEKLALKHRRNTLIPDCIAKIEKCIGEIRENCRENTLVISCGDPIALKVADMYGLQATIVTDHLVTQSVKDVLVEYYGSCPPEVNPFILDMENFERSPKASAMAFLCPPEFGMPDYREYLHRNRGWRECLEIGGLLYDPIPPRELECAPHYHELFEINKNYPVVIVFGGGGIVWNEIYDKLHEKINAGELDQEKGDDAFALIIRDVEDHKIVDNTWKLFKPGDLNGKLLDDPGKMMYWYEACTLLVGRGGLAAQQIIATMLSDTSSAPNMFFITEPGHPQIQSEREMLSTLGLVHTCDNLADFISNPFNEITKVLNTRSSYGRIRDQARLRYAPGIIDRLADFILGKYEPHRP